MELGGVKVNKSKIEWCDYTWNPVAGCLHGCDYCYARRIAERFGNRYMPYGGGINVLDEPFDGEKGIDPYPYGFEPTFHRYRLGEPARKTKPSKIFVVSMGDLFGNWVPDEWIQDVFAACEKAPQHTYLFLTKNPERYRKIAGHGDLPPQHWYGYTLTGIGQKPEQLYSNWRTFVSLEPLLGMPDMEFLKYDNTLWVILGAETGNCKGKVVPKREWIEKIVEDCKFRKVPLFMKNSLKDIWGAPLIQEWPEGMRI